MEDKFYTGIDNLPIWNWIQINEKQDFRYLARAISDYAAASKEAVERLWRAIYEEFLQRFGFGETFIEVMRHRIEIGRLKVMMGVTGDRSHQTFVEIAELEIAELLKPAGKPMDFYRLKAYVEKKNGFRIDAHQTTVVEFYTYLELIKK